MNKDPYLFKNINLKRHAAIPQPELNSLANERRVRIACFYLLYFAILTVANHS